MSGTGPPYTSPKSKQARDVPCVPRKYKYMGKQMQIMNVFAAVALLAKVLSEEDDGSLPYEVSNAVDEFNSIVDEIQLTDQDLTTPEVELVVNAAIKLVTNTTEHMSEALENENYIFVFHQSLTLALMDLDRSLIRIQEGVSPDDLSEDMLMNREKLQQVCLLIQQDPTLLDSKE